LLGTSEEGWGVDVIIVEHTVIIILQVLYYKCLLVQEVISYGADLILAILILKLTA